MAGANYGKVIDCNFTNTEAARSAGAKLFSQDSDGDMTPVLDDFIACGVQCFYPCEPVGGMDMVKLEKYQGFSADIAAAISLFFSSTFGIPVSTTHAKTTAIMGVGAVKRLSAINFGVVKEMAMTWLLTFPGCGLIGFLMTKLFMYLF